MVEAASGKEVNAMTVIADNLDRIMNRCFGVMTTSNVIALFIDLLKTKINN